MVALRLVARQEFPSGGALRYVLRRGWDGRLIT